MNSNQSHTLSNEEDGLFRFVYTSQSTSGWIKRTSDLTNIIRVAKINNQRYNITGIIFHQRKFYYQYAEGSEKSLTDLKNNLLLDKRHFRIKIHDFSHIDRRRFKKWALRTQAPKTLKKNQHSIQQRLLPLRPEQWQGDEWDEFARLFMN